MQNKLIFLIGFMGVGKTTIGKKLAKQLHYTFIDLDQAIESKFKITINEYFSKYGEKAFRKEETKMLEEIINTQKKAIIAVGGGLPCFNENMQRMNRVGLTCYLHRPPKELYQRLKNSKSNRPLIKELKEEELLNFIENKIVEREPFYSLAHIKVFRNQQNIKELMKILEES